MKVLCLAWEMVSVSRLGHSISTSVGVVCQSEVSDLPGRTTGVVDSVVVVVLVVVLHGQRPKNHRSE